VTVEFASTLNDEKILQDRKMKIEKGRKTHPSAISKADKLAKFANDLGLKPDDVLGKRDPKAADDGNEQAKEKGESDDASKGEKKVKAEPKTGLDSRRLYVYNFPFSITKEDLRQVFEKFGSVEECIIPTDAEHRSKGFGYVAFESENDAIQAFSKLDNQIVFGRILHIKPSETSRRSQFGKETKEKVKKDEGSSYKQLKKEQFLKNLNDNTSWNSLFLNPNTVMEYVAQEYGLTKLDLLNREVENPAVKIALAETKIINETKEWLKENGIDIKLLEGNKSTTERSRTILLVKNLPKDVTKPKLSDLLNRFGFVNRLLLPPNKTIAIAQFRNIDHANNVFSKLSGYNFHGLPIYLEFAPHNFLPEDFNDEEDQKDDDGTKETKVNETTVGVKPALLQEEEDKTEIDAKEKTVYVKNLNFSSTEEGLKDFLRENGYASSIKFLKIITKNGKSCGYGFIEFNTVDDAEKALRNLNQKLLDSHKLELTISRKPQASKTKTRKEKEEVAVSNKIVVRNVDFAASKKELNDLVSAFGEVRSVRMPKKVTGEHRGFAFVEFSNEDEAKNAYDALSHSHFYGRKLVIEYAKE
jgi:multiple RNA-binding domain-containing protein 1